MTTQLMVSNLHLIQLENKLSNLSNVYGSGIEQTIERLQGNSNSTVYFADVLALKTETLNQRIAAMDDRMNNTLEVIKYSLFALIFLGAFLMITVISKMNLKFPKFGGGKSKPLNISKPKEPSIEDFEQGL
jgi:hypothetical protein